MFRRLSSHAQGVLLVASSAVTWSLGGLFFRALDLNPWTTSFWRSLFAAILISAYLWKAQRRSFLRTFRQDKLLGLIVCLGVATSLVTFLPALALTSVANVAVIYATAPVLTAVLGRVLLREPLDVATIVCAAVVAIGGVLLFIGSGSSPRIGGDALALISTVGLVFAALAIRAAKESSLIVYICVSNILVAMVSLPAAPLLAISQRQAILLMLFAFLQVALSFVLFTIGARKLPAKQTALINAMEGPLSPLWVWLAFGEQPSSITLISGSIIMAAVLIHIAITSRQQGSIPHDRPIP